MTHQSPAELSKELREAAQVVNAADHPFLAGQIREAAAALDAQARRIEELNRALIKYGNHLGICDMSDRVLASLSDRGCGCGWQATSHTARAALRGEQL